MRSTEELVDDIDAPGACAGATLTVVLGMQKFAPVQYFSFDVGPFTMQVVVKPGERLSEVYSAAMAHLQELAEDEYKRRLPQHLEWCKQSIAEARAKGLGGR